MKRGILVCGVFALLWVNVNFANAAPASQASSAASQPDRSVEDLRMRSNAPILQIQRSLRVSPAAPFNP